MFDSNKTWFCKQLRTEDAKQIGEQLNIAISEADHSEATKLFQKVKKYMKIRINENYFLPLKNIHTCLAKLDIPENTAFITMGIGIMILGLAVGKLEYLFGTLRKLKDSLPVEQEYLTTLIKMIGITYIGQFSAGICKDNGYQAVGGQIELFAKLSILALSIPGLAYLTDVLEQFL